MTKLLSVCLIVKNEQDVLDRCLSSISELADEIIVVDTGSTDQSKEIAHKHTNHVYDFEWVNDFSAARNESIKHATSKWVLVLDADEYIDANDTSSIRTYLENLTPSAINIFTVSVFSFKGESMRKANLLEGSIGRLFANGFGIKFVRPIHEQLASKDGQQLRSLKAPISIYHTGYLDSVLASKNKSERNLQLFSEHKKQSNFTPYDYFTLGNEYTLENNSKQALYYYEKAYKKSKPTTAWHYLLVFELILNHMRNDRIYEAWTLLEHECKDKKNYPDYHSMQGLIYEHLGLYGQAKSAFQTALRKSDELASTNTIFWLVSPMLAMDTPLTKLVAIAMAEHNTKDTIYYLTKKVNSDPSDYASLLQLFELMLHFEKDYKQVHKFISMLFPNPDNDQLYLLFKVFNVLGDSKLVTAYYEQLSGNRQLSLQDLVKYALITNNQNGLLEHINLQKSNPLTKELLHVLSLSYMVWGIDVVDSFQIEEEDQALQHAYEFYKGLKSQSFSEDWIEQYHDFIFRLVTDLLRIRQYDTFDRYIEQLSHPVLINALANYFYSIYKYDDAVSYYSVLLDANQLTLPSYLNLAMLHINDGLYDDAIPFLERAIEESPNYNKLYIYLLTHCSNEETKSKYRKQLLDRFPQYRKLPFLQQLLK